MASKTDPNAQLPPIDLIRGAGGVDDPSVASGGLRRAVFAAGCFWCLEQKMEEIPGVVSAVSGYAGGTVENPTYRQVGGGSTGHREALLVTYDPEQTSYSVLLDAFWHNVDPFDSGGMFVDRGEPYLGAVFYLNEEQQRTVAESLRKIVQRFEREPVTDILSVDVFYPAENYHQDYYKKNPLRYRLYTLGNGRADRLKKLWGDPKNVTPIVAEVSR